MKKLYILLCLYSLVWLGCSGAPSSAITEYRVTIGTATLDDYNDLSSKILNRHRFLVDRTQDRGNGAVIECKYEYPALSNEEVLKGIEEIRYQLLLEARLKGSGAGTYSVRAIVKTYGRFSGNETWVDIQANNEIKGRIKLMANDLKTEFENKIRVF